MLLAAASCTEENPDFGDYNPGDSAGDESVADGDTAPGVDDGASGDGVSGDGAGDTSPGDDGAPGDTADDGSIGDSDGDSPGGDSSGDGDDGPAPSDAVRFIVFGDGGTGDANQKKVAAAVKTVCAERGCQFALYLGDNIYEDGVSGPEDSQFASKFEEPYAELDFPFYVALGNHDYGSNGANIFPDDNKSAAQVEYTAHSEKWNLPAFYYTFREGPVAFFVLDTNAIVLDRFRDADTQAEWLHEQMAASDAPWKIVMGHHPYISNGEHGNAGDYKGPIGFELHDGSTLRDLVDAEVCGKAQLFFSGHDHDREWLDKCDTSFIVSGAAAKLDAIHDRGSPSRWSDGTKRGFMWAEIAGDTFTGIFYDEDGTMNYMDTVAR